MQCLCIVVDKGGGIEIDDGDHGIARLRCSPQAFVFPAGCRVRGMPVFGIIHRG